MKSRSSTLQITSSGDIDILVIMIGIFGCSNNYIVVDNGTGKSRRKIRIDSSTLSERHQKALVGFHAFTRNDYVSSFMRKTKKLWKVKLKVFRISLEKGLYKIKQQNS